MNSCEQRKCSFWNAKNCTDKLPFKNNGDLCCRYHPDAVLDTDKISDVYTQLSVANQEIVGLREASEWIANVACGVGKFGHEPESGEYEEAVNCAKQALSHPALVDEEKEVLKEALNLACNFIVDKKLHFTATSDQMVTEFFNQAKSKIEAVK